MARRPRPTGNGGGNGGSRVPSTNVILYVENPETDVTVKDGQVQVNGIIHGMAIGKFDEKFKHGEQVTVRVRNKDFPEPAAGQKDWQAERAGKLAAKVSDPKEFAALKIQEKGFLLLENVFRSGDGLNCQYFTTFGGSKSFDHPAYGEVFEDYPVVDQLVHVTNQFRGYQNIAAYHPEQAMVISGPGYDQTVATIASTVAETEADENSMADPVIADWVAKAKNFENASALEKLEVIFDFYGLSPEFGDGAAHSAVLRVIDMDGEKTELATYNATPFASRSVDDGTGNYRSMNFREVVELNLNPTKDRDGNSLESMPKVTFEDMVSKGIVDAINARAVETADGSLSVGQNRADALIADLVDIEGGEPGFMFEIIPVANYPIGNDTTKISADWGKPFNRLVEYDYDGEKVREFQNMVSYATFRKKARLKDRLPIPKYFITGVAVDNITTFGKEKSLKEIAFTPATLITPAAEEAGLKEALTSLSRELPKMVVRKNSQNNDNDNDNENSNDGQGQHDASAEGGPAPAM